MLHELKGAFGPALLHLGLTSEQITAVTQSAARGKLVLTGVGLSPGLRAGVKQAYDGAFMKGFHPALVLGGTVLLTAAAVANRFIPGRHTVRGAEAAGMMNQPAALAH